MSPTGPSATSGGVCRSAAVGRQAHIQRTDQSRGEIRDPLLSDADRFYRGGSPFSAEEFSDLHPVVLNLARTLRHH